jgi:glucan biosynthesis protein C
MNTFFFLSGHFSTLSLKRKSRTTFLKDKYLRLGLPTLLFTLFSAPIIIPLLRLGKGDAWEWILGYWKSLRGVRGPVWYCAVLLIFDTLYSFLPDRNYNVLFKIFERVGFEGNLVLDVLVNFLIRLFWPTGRVFELLNVQLGYLAGNVASYLFGASMAGAEIELPELGRVSRGVLVGCCVVSGVAMMGLLNMFPEEYTILSCNGGFNLLAAAYAVWNETTGYAIGSGLVRLFEKKKWLSGRWIVGSWEVARGSYAAFVVHPVVLVAAMVGFGGWRVDGVVKTAVVGTVGVIGSWAVGWGLLKVPGVGRVL